MAHLLTTVTKNDFGKLLAIEGKRDDVHLVMQSMSFKLTTLSPVLLIDTNASFAPATYSSSALKRIHLATPFTLSELQRTIKKVGMLADKTRARVLLITSIDHLLLDKSLSAADAEYALLNILDELTYLTETRQLITILGLSEGGTDRTRALSRILEPRLDFYSRV